ncbi:MAG: hypothetical protein FWB76_06270 [Oscillospiraceae bacterium]|nr:hypothetical protein [Oscillospiraceae bacterium]
MEARLGCALAKHHPAIWALSVSIGAWVTLFFQIPMTTPLAATQVKRVFGHEYFAAIQTGFFFNGSALCFCLLSVMKSCTTLRAAKQPLAAAMWTIFNWSSTYWAISFTILVGVLTDIVMLVPTNRTAKFLMSTVTNKRFATLQTRFFFCHLRLMC